MPNATYLNLVTFPVPLEFKNMALGVRRGVKIGELTGTIYLPLPNHQEIEKPFTTLLPPRVRNIDYAARLYARLADASDDFRPFWGKYFTWHPKDPAGTAIASVQNAVLAFPARQNKGTLSVQELAKKCIQEFPAWSTRLSDWIEVLTSDDLNAAHPLHATIAQQHWTSTAWIHPNGNRLGYAFVNPPGTVLGSSGANALDVDLWTRAVRAANNKREIPEIWALVRDARAAERRRLGRRAVLDAATAAELVIENQLRAHLLRINIKAFVDRLMKSTWQVSRRLELMRSLGLWLPQNIEADLTLLRNRVVHDNARVSRDEAKAAVDAAEQLARRYELAMLK